MTEKYFYNQTMAGNANMWLRQEFANYISKDKVCCEEAEKVVIWSLDYVRKVRCDDEYSIEFPEIATFAKDNLSKIKEGVLNYSYYDYLRKDNANIDEILLHSVAEYLCGFRIRVKGYYESYDEEYCAVSDIAYWFQMVYGKISSDIGECQTVDYLIWFFDTPIHGAWQTYKPTMDNILALKTTLLKPVDELMKRYNKRANEVTSEYLMREYDSKSDEELLSNIRKLTGDTEYFNTDLNLKNMSWLLLERKMYADWVQAFEHLHYPILQGQLLCGVVCPNDCFELIKLMQGSGNSRKKVNQSLIRERWFYTICKVSANLRDDRGNESVADGLKEETLKRRDEWQDGLKYIIEGFLDLSKDVVGEEETVRWITSLPYYHSDKDNLSCRINNEIIDKMLEYCSTTFHLSNMVAKGNNLDYLLLLLMNEVENRVNDTVRIKELSESLFECIYRAKTFTKGVSVTNDELLLITKISKALAFIDENTRNALFEKFNIIYEGYDAHDGIYRNAEINKHSFILAIKLLLSVEVNFHSSIGNCKDYFKVVAEEVVRYYKYLPDRYNENAYCYPLSVAMLIASQKLTLVPWLADVVIENVDNFIDVIRIIMYGKDGLSEENIEGLQRRKDKEWNLWKIVFTDTSRIDCIVTYEKMMKELKLQ